MEVIGKGRNGSIDALYGESMFHNRVSAEDDGPDDSLKAAEFEQGPEQKIINDLKGLVEKAAAEGSPTNGRDQS